MLVAMRSLVRRTSEPISLLRTTTALTEVFVLRNLLVAAILAATASSAVAQTRRSSFQWWNPKDVQSFHSRVPLEGVTPTGFVDPKGKIPLTAISSSALLREVVNIGGWSALKPPSSKTAAAALKILEGGRDNPGWDLACGLLRAQLVAELDGAPIELTRREVVNVSLHKSAGSALSVMMLRDVSRMKGRTGVSFPNPLPHNVDSRWQSWNGKNPQEMAQQTLIAFYCFTFGSPKLSILDAAQYFKDPVVLEAVGNTLHTKWATHKSFPEMGAHEKMLPPALRTPSLHALKDIYIPFAENHPKRYVASGVAFQICRQAKDDRRALVFGRRFLATAPKSNSYYKIISDQMSKLEKKLGPTVRAN